MSGVGPMRGQGGRKGYIKRILASKKLVQERCPDTGKPSHFLEMKGILSFLGSVYTTPLLHSIGSFA